MTFYSRIRTRVKLAYMGQKALGEFYRPILSAIHVAGAPIKVDPKQVLTEIGLEFRDFEYPRELDRSLRVFPDLYDSDDLTREVIWRIVRDVEPAVVVETGVANGLSSQTILDALFLNDHGSLHSFDIDARAQASVPIDLRPRWKFTLLDAGNAMRDLRSNVLEYSGQIGVWFHDSDHNYRWQLQEYELAASLLAPGGVLITDDADGTEAFADFCLSQPTWDKVALFDTRKVCGFARKPLH